MQAVGIDIGTTTICGIVMDAVSGEVLDVKTLSNDSVIKDSENPFARIQDPCRIWKQVSTIYGSFTDRYSQIACIGITGQMHGIVYTDKNGEAVSPLYTWQDERGNEEDENGRSYAQSLTDLTGYRAAAGFGLTTHYFNVKNHLVPEGARKIATIQDYIVMKLTGSPAPVLSTSNAASLGLFDLKQLCFDKEAVVLAGMDPGILPDVTAKGIIAGKTKEGIPVSCGIGDNQASVIGSVRNADDSILCNVGTGSQISTGIRYFVDTDETELRPLDGNQYILVGASLCGGRAYAALEQFLRSTVELMTGMACDTLYDKMGETLETLPGAEDSEELHFAATAAGTQGGVLEVDTRFCGTRNNPEMTGGIYGLTLDNFTPAHLIRGVLSGIAEELLTYYEEMKKLGATGQSTLIGSGNAIRRNPHMKRALEKLFGMKMLIPEHKEEASYGAALYALVAAGIYPTLEKAQELIRYN